MQHLHARPTQWVQWDAGIWSRRVPSGRIEICYASDMNGAAIYDVLVYDVFGNRSDAHPHPVVCRDIASAKQAGDRLAQSFITDDCVPDVHAA